ncbi:glycine--tRNA ligase subunit beta [Novosphingobium flavum]|uniref:glycine--tRNA ligase subunit beta n=1 Tax=Novosphingobium aerophilum TaxID=2839843 RepID=UPI00163958C2|nr:glycine--tRNA ligase subunit beta [Novosphingobium aerophilum]MBC2660491.1 glycine--tRNA ligase subunit beta [Novosphingobium aerophilum]
MPDFLLELRSEEIPARMQAGARASLDKLFHEQMTAAGVSLGAVTVYSTPRRLALIARDLPLATAAVSEELKGPKVGAPPQALEGFLRKTGLTEDQLVERGGVLFAVTEKPGRATKDVLAEAIPAICRAFPWPKSMRWGAASISTESLRWVRPLSGIVAILGDEPVDCEVGGIRSGTATLGHRFHHPGAITIGGAADYVDKLRAAHVLVDHAEREGMVREQARAAAAKAGLTLVEDEGLVVENAGLTEWPVPLLGRFDEAYLEVPPETIQLTARTNQKYFICRDAQGQLANAFVCTANIAATDGGAAIVAGNRKVLAARLSDARFFWEQDRKTPLSVHAEKLARITFHEKLGTVADKVERVAKLARWLVESGVVVSSPERGGGPAQLVEGHPHDGAGASGTASAPPTVPLHRPADGPPPRAGEDASLADLAEQAARLCKADLVTEMVGEFPELQGLMGGYYARAEDLPDAVADAIRNHYKPVGQGDEVPTAPVTVAVALADKLDTLRSFFAIDEKPTGSKDPFALRRAALGIIRIVTENGLRLPLIQAATAAQAEPVEAHTPALAQELLAFFADRLKVQQKEAGVRHDLIDAVFALGGEDDLVRLLARVHALQAFVGTEDGANLLAGYKRAANILKKEEWQSAALSYTPEPEEKALIDALDSASPRADAALAAEDFAGAMAALATLRGPIDAFFDKVTVNDADPAKRAARLDLLEQFRAAVHKVADFSRIEG